MALSIPTTQTWLMAGDCPIWTVNPASQCQSPMWKMMILHMAKRLLHSSSLMTSGNLICDLALSALKVQLTIIWQFSILAPSLSVSVHHKWVAIPFSWSTGVPAFNFGSAVKLTLLRLQICWWLNSWCWTANDVAAEMPCGAVLSVICIIASFGTDMQLCSCRLLTVLKWNEPFSVCIWLLYFATVVCATLNALFRCVSIPLWRSLFSFAELVFGAINRVLQALMCCTELHQTPSCICQVVWRHFAKPPLWRSLFIICWTCRRRHK